MKLGQAKRAQRTQRAPLTQRALALMSTAAVMAMTGCNSGPSTIDIPVVDPAAASAAALQFADKDADGALSREECAVAPSLANAFAKYDADQDGRLTAAEIQTRIASWTAQGAKVVPISFYVRMNGQPLIGAQVVLEPEPFMGDVLATATSNVSGSGACGPTVSPELLSKEIPVGMFCGLYRVRISHPDKAIPVKYNEQTQLGMEVAPDYDFFNRKTFELSTR